MEKKKQGKSFVALYNTEEKKEAEEGWGGKGGRTRKENKWTPTLK